MLYDFDVHNQNVDILSRVIIHDAYRDAESIRERAKKESKSIKEEGMCKVKGLTYKAKKMLAHAQFSKNNSKIISQAKFKARCEILMQKEHVLEKVIKEFQREFFSLPNQNTYPLIVKCLMIGGLKCLKGEGSAFVCRANSRDQFLLYSSLINEVKRELNINLSLDKSPLEIMGGVILFDSDFRVSYNNSLEALFQRNWQRMRYIVAECIFGEN
ncbi:MAG: V-type ATP synthase subunit E [bacterium]